MPVNQPLTAPQMAKIKSVRCVKRREQPLFDRLEIGIALQESLGLGLVFDPEQRAGHIGQRAAGPDHRGGLIQNQRLQGHQPRKTGLGQAPFGVGGASPCAAARTVLMCVL